MPDWLSKLLESDKLWGGIIGGGAALIVAKVSFKNAIRTEWFKGTVRESIEPRLISFQGDVNKDLERLRNDLNTARMIQEVRFHQVYEKAADGICDLLAAMGELNAASRTFLATYHLGDLNKTKMEEMDVFIAAFKKVNLVIFQKRCLIPTNVHKAAEKHLDIVRAMAEAFRPLSAITTPDANTFVDFWKTKQKEFDEKVSTDYELFCGVIKKTFAVDEYFDAAFEGAKTIK
jgi:hypothetical protein